MDYISKIKLGDTTYQIKDSDAMHSGDGDTKNTTGTTNKTDTKLFLAGATSQGANPVTYSNTNCYIGTDNCLYSGGSKVLTSHDGNTLNTAGASNKAATKLFLVGATAQTDGIQSYSNVNCYVGTDNCLYSNGSKVLTSYTNTTYAAGTGVTITGSNNAINVTYGTAANTACQGNDSRLSDSRPASDVSSWAKAANKPSYSYREISYSTSLNNASGAVTVDGSIPIHILSATGNMSSISFTSAVPADCHSCHIIITNNSGEKTVTISHGSTVTIGGMPYTFKCPGAEDLSLTVKAGGYIELDLFRLNMNIFVRGV